MDTNDSLRVASLWHSMHAISQQLSPVSGCLGIELLQADTFDLHCFQSLTGNFFKHQSSTHDHISFIIYSVNKMNSLCLTSLLFTHYWLLFSMHTRLRPATCL